MKKLMLLISCFLLQPAFAQTDNSGKIIDGDYENLGFQAVDRQAEQLGVAIFDVETFFSMVRDMRTMHPNRLGNEIIKISRRVQYFRLIADNFNVLVVARALQEGRGPDMLNFLNLVAESQSIGSLALLTEIYSRYLGSTQDKSLKLVVERDPLDLKNFFAEMTRILKRAEKRGMKSETLREEARKLEAAMFIAESTCTKDLKKSFFKR